MTEAILRMCLDRGASSGASIVVVSHLAARQAKRRLAALDPPGTAAAAVTTTRELDAFMERWPSDSLALCVVTDTFYGRLLEAVADRRDPDRRDPDRRDPDAFRRAIFDDAWSLAIPGCRDPMAPVAWSVIGSEPVYGGSTSRGFLGRSLDMGSSVDGTVWCDDVRVSTGPAPGEGMFRYPRDGGGSSSGWEGGGPVERSVDPCRPSCPLDTALTLIDAEADDPHCASRLAGTVRATMPGWRGFREGGDRCCPICLLGPDEVACEAPSEAPSEAPREAPREAPSEARAHTPAARAARGVLRVRSRCCGREFCAGCLARNIVSRAGRGLPPSCPQCRDPLGGCLETCDPVVVVRVASPGRAATVLPDTGPGTRPLKSVEEAVTDAVNDALAKEGTRLLVVASPRGLRDITRTPWFERSALRWGGLERLAGNPSAVDAGLERFRLGERRLMVVRGGARKVAGVRMPWVTHILLLDCYCPSKFWARMTGASPIDTLVRRRLSAASGAAAGAASGAASGATSGYPARPTSGYPCIHAQQTLKIKRILPFRYFLGRARRLREIALARGDASD